MSKPKTFQLLTEREIGLLPMKLRRRWRTLMKRQEVIEAAQEKFSERASALMNEVEQHIKPQLVTTKAQSNVKITRDGEVVQTFCSCPHCQALIQGLKVSQVVEEMIKLGHISDMDEIAKARAAAAQIDGRHRLLLLN